MSAESGSPILATTMCRVGAHIFTWSASGAFNGEREPIPGLRCDCGLTRWPAAVPAVGPGEHNPDGRGHGDQA